MSNTKQQTSRRGPLTFFVNNLGYGAGDPEMHHAGIGRWLLALVMIALGIRGLIIGDFAGVAQRIPIEHLPAHNFFAYLSALIELVTGIGILIPRIAKVSAAVMSVFALLWMVLLKFPAIISAPLVEVAWLDAGETAVILAGAWIVFATLADPDGKFFSGRNGVRNARLLFVLALPTIGLSHFIYLEVTVSFIPEWIPAPYFWAYLTGAGSIAAGLALLFGVWPRLAATLEAVMLSAITLLVWPSRLMAEPSDAVLTTVLMSSIIAAGAWIVADSYRSLKWFAVTEHR